MKVHFLNYNQASLLFLLIFVSLLFFSAFSRVEAVEQENIQHIIQAFETGKYESSLGQTLTILSVDDSLNTMSRTLLHQYAAFNLIAMNRQSDAKTHIQKVYTLTPSLQLNPVTVSPKIIAVFESIRAEMDLTTPTSTDSLSFLYSDTKSDVSIQKAIQKALIFPGLGHFSIGEQAKGRLLMGAEAIMLTGLVVAHVQRGNARDDYLAERKPDQVTAAYNDYKNWHYIRTGFAVASASVWLYSIVDISLSPVPTKDVFLSANPSQVLVTCRF